MKLNINFSEFDKIQLGCINKKTFLVLTKNANSAYLVIPACLTYSLTTEVIEITCTSTLVSDTSVFNIFVNTFNSIKNNTQLYSKKKIMLKGLGFRSIYDDKANTLTFKLGFSHQNVMAVPDYIKNIKVKKNMILFESSDKVLLGDYFRKIYKLREADIYKGKGFSYQYDNKKLKVIKKK